MPITAAPPLTDQEKECGRLFRAQQQEALSKLHETDPVEYQPPPWQGQLRHNCPQRDNRSTALELREVYNFSEAMTASDGTVISAGRFGFHYREGKCRSCKQRARTRAGKFEDAHKRPPLEGRTAR